MRAVAYTRQFQKDLKLMIRRGKHSDKLHAAIDALYKGEMLPPSCRDHKLTGNFAGRRECHIEPDWLLIYKSTIEEIVFERTGTHADLFE